jgi:hypothetical protein
MRKKLIAAVAGLGFTAGGAVAQKPPSADPDFPPTGPLAPPVSPKDLLPPPPEVPQFARHSKIAERAQLSPNEKTRKGLPTPESVMEAEGFRGAIFSTPIPFSRQPVIPTGGPLAAPIIMPGAPTKHGQPTFNVIPAGDPFDPTATPNTEQFVWGPVSSGSPPDPDRAWVWGSAELLLGNTSGVNVPPLVTTGPASAGLAAGAIGAPGTVVLFGGRKMLDNWRTGLRIEAGAWFGPSHVWGASARVYSLFSTSDQLVGEGDGTNVVNLPQFFPVGGVPVQFPMFVGFPGVTVGTVATTVQTTFTGGDLSLRRLLVSTEPLRFEAFAGYRQLHLGDELGAAFRASGGIVGVLALRGDDSVRTRNNFYGGQVGGLGSLALGRFTVQGVSSVALGMNASDLDFSRTRLATVGAVVVPLVQATSGGRVNYFSVVAEGGVRLSFRVTDHAKLTVGYTGIYWSNVRRAQEQFTLGPTLTGGTTHFYTNMMSLGAEVRY